MRPPDFQPRFLLQCCGTSPRARNVESVLQTVCWPIEEALPAEQNETLPTA